VNSSTTVLPDLRLVRTATIRSAHAINALLFGVCSELTERSPTPTRLEDLHDALANVSNIQLPTAQLGLLLKREVDKAISDECYYRAVWREYQDLLNPMSRASVHPSASSHCDTKLINRDTCHLENGKPCPFGEWYCANRLGAPCDHVSLALGIASRLWRDLADANTPADEQLTRQRCRTFSQAHLSLWVSRIADSLLSKAQTELYQVEALLIGSLCSTKV